ncbi:hypothetical protein CEXT_189451 [Caerostris extrusa]|uniref:Uncharacterized protein n=1 Tax=Caerostris extrusa TaxID=172846 RepID=A0AAV4TNZ5_CAEEX|nr:hypothetical protein CEXT_189451 [Caerostris extrusa]
MDTLESSTYLHQQDGASRLDCCRDAVKQFIGRHNALDIHPEFYCILMLRVSIDKEVLDIFKFKDRNFTIIETALLQHSAYKYVPK